MSIIQDLWSDTAGRIFLFSLTSYLFGFMVYGGYLFAFFGRKGSLPFGLADFSIADLISIFPAAIVTIIDIIPKAFLGILKGLFIHFVVPIIFGIVIRSVTGWRLNQISSDTIWIGFITLFGLVLWLTSYLASTLQTLKIHWAFFILIEILGAILFFATIPNPGEPLPVIPVPTTQSQQGIKIILDIVLGLEIIAIPYAFGVGIANTAIKSKLLIKIDRLTLRQPILKEGMRKIILLPEIKGKNSLQELWLVQKNLPIDIGPDTYEWIPMPNRDAYLIATFEKFVLIYSQELKAEDNHTIIINRDVILSMEFSHKNGSATSIQE